MALNLFSRYPGRANPASIDYPQGSFKNKTAPAATDGTLLEQDWANDSQGFLQSILSYFGVTASGAVDKVGASQYFDALTSDPTELKKGMPLVASQADLNAGTDDAKQVTPKKLRAGFSSSFLANGYIAFPTWMGAFIIQWGFSGNVAKDVALEVIFPIAFPNSCFAFSPTDYSSVGNASACWASDLPLKNKVATHWSPGASGVGTAPDRPCLWIAIGK